MADDENAVKIDLAVQRMSSGVIPGPKLFEVLEVNDRSAVVFAEVESVEEVHVDRRRDDPVRRQQLAQIQVSGRGILERVVVAVRKHRERERASPAGHANVSIQRHVCVEKWPRGARPEVRERRDIDSARDVRRIRRVVDQELGERCGVGERRRAVDEGIELDVAGNGRVLQTWHFPLLRRCVPRRPKSPRLRSEECKISTVSIRKAGSQTQLASYGLAAQLMSIYARGIET